MLQILVIAPGRGAGLFEDDGYFLTMAWQAAEGHGLDKQLPQTAHYLVSSVLMQLGLREVLHFRWFNTVLSAISATVFFLALAPRGWRSTAAPIGIAICILSSLYSIQGANSLALAFFLLGSGLAFVAARRAVATRQLLSAAAGLFLALAAFMHAAVFIAILLYCGLLLWLFAGLRRSLLPWALLAGAAAMWGTYLSHLGLNKFLHTPYAHDFASGYLLLRVTLILRYYWECLAAFTLCLCPLAFVKMEWPRRFEIVQKFLCAVLTIFFVYCMAFYVLQYFNGVPLVELKLPTVNIFRSKTFFLFTSEAVWVSCIPGGLSFFVLVFAMLRLLAANVATASPVAPGWSWNSLITWCRTVFGSEDMRQRWVLAFVGLALITAATGVGSNTRISQGMTFFAGPAFGLAILVCVEMDGCGKFITTTLAAIWLAMTATFALTYNHAGNHPVVATDRHRLEWSPFTGLLESSQYISAMDRLRDAYVQNGCASMPLATTDYIPYLHYIFSNPIPPGVGTPRPAFGFNAEHFRSALPSAAGWCVFDLTSRETWAAVTRTGTDPRADTRLWLADNSDRRVVLESPTPDLLSDITLYIRDRR